MYKRNSTVCSRMAIYAKMSSIVNNSHGYRDAIVCYKAKFQQNIVLNTNTIIIRPLFIVHDSPRVDIIIIALGICPNVYNRWKCTVKLSLQNKTDSSTYRSAYNMLQQYQINMHVPSLIMEREGGFFIDLVFFRI